MKEVQRKCTKWKEGWENPANNLKMKNKELVKETKHHQFSSLNPVSDKYSA